MRLLVTGVDTNGGSCAVQDGPVAMQGDASLGGMLFSMLYSSPSLPALAEGGRAADKLDLVLPAGGLRWATIEDAPGAELPLHHTDTVDFDIVLAGSVELILDDGGHLLQVGDSAVITGIDHGWRAGPDGCRLNVLTIGGSAPESTAG